MDDVVHSASPPTSRSAAARTSCALRSNGYPRVADSLGNNGASADDPLYRPYVGRLALFGARTCFSLTSTIPPLRKKFIADISTYRGAEP